MIGIINYGVGNISAFLNVYKRLGIAAKAIDDPNEISEASKLILPGVGHFDFAMQKFRDSGLLEAVDRRVKDGVPVLGVCVGMQMLADKSEEGQLPGLGWIEGEVKLFQIEDVRLKPHVPHMGWNTLLSVENHPILKGLGTDSSFYFLHSFYFEPKNANDTLIRSKYGIEFTSMVYSKNVFGAQFHPEKSHEAGVKLLRNFAEL